MLWWMASICTLQRVSESLFCSDGMISTRQKCMTTTILMQIVKFVCTLHFSCLLLVVSRAQSTIILRTIALKAPIRRIVTIATHFLMAIAPKRDVTPLLQTI